jgi:hypothetical protein
MLTKFIWAEEMKTININDLLVFACYICDDIK